MDTPDVEFLCFTTIMKIINLLLYNDYLNIFVFCS